MSPRVRVVSCLLVLLLLAQPALARKSLTDRVNELLSHPQAERGFWGIHVVDLDSGEILYSRNAEKLFVPASNTKLFTTAAALALIGPDHRFRTTVETSGTLDRYGRLSGDLVLVGRGDPNLSGRTLPYNLRTERTPPHMGALEELADQVAQKGVKYIEGDVVADDSYYAFERYAEGWAQDDLVWEWGAPVSALSINDNVIFVKVLPADRAGEKAFVSFEPFAGYYHIDNRILTTPAGTGPRKIYISREPGSSILTLWGNIPLDDSGASEALAIEDPAEFAARIFRRLLEQRGIIVYGRTRTQHTELAKLSTFSVTTLASRGGGGGKGSDGVSAEAPHPAVPEPLVLAQHQSAPFMDDLTVINKVSQNLHAELALRLLGREKGNSGTIEDGLEVLEDFLTQAGVERDEYAFFDGSGLSRQNLASPRATVKLLMWIQKQPWASEYEQTLPAAGIDGSLSGRLRGTEAQARVRAKTGSLGHVNALSGYALTLKGRRLAFSIFSNNHNLRSSEAIALIDSIVRVLVNDRSYPRK